MTQSRVHSVDRLERLHAALARFGADAQTALGAAALALGRAHDALADRGAYWAQQVNRRHEEAGQARAALVHARALHKGESVGCVEQELALRKARERLAEAEGKVAAVKRWQRARPDAEKDFEALARGLSGRLETDLRVALALLANKIASLEAYLAVAAAELAPPAETREAP